MAKLEKFLLGTMLVGGLTLGAPGCSSKNKDSKEDKTEAEAKNKEIKPSNYATNNEYNVALFENCRSDIKFALAFCENYYPFIYWCGEAWTGGSGLTILYNSDGTYTKVTKDTKVPTIAESDVYEGRYLTYDILPDIKEYIKVPMDKNTLIAACVLRYCIGSKNFNKSSFVKQLNNGETGTELAKTLTGWRQQKGVPNRCYFFAALMAGKLEYADLLDLRAEGCYNLTWNDIFVCSKGKPVVDKDGFYEWDFSKIDTNLQKAKQPRQVKLNIGGGKTAIVDCKLAKEIVPDYVLQDVLKHTNTNQSETISFADVLSNMANDSSYVAYKNGNYKKAIKTGKSALKVAVNNKQKGAANYNIGIAYTELGKYNKAVRYLEQSLAENKTKAAKVALETAKQKQTERNEKHRKTAEKILLSAAVVGVAAYYSRKTYFTTAQKQR